MVGMGERSYAHGTGDTPLLGCTIGQVLDAAVSSYPEQDALVVRHQNLRFSYLQFLEQVELVAKGLLRLGIQKGDRLALWADQLR
jgi:fatty-acyl-CoA synthase